MKMHTHERPVLDARLTTIDNPYSPFTEFAQWFLYDMSHGYHSCELTANIAPVDDDTPENEYFWRIEDAIDLIVENHPDKRYIKVTREPYAYLKDS